MFIDYFAYENLNSEKINEHEIELINEEDTRIKAYPDVTEIVRTLRVDCMGRNDHIAIASRALNRSLALKAIDLFGWTPYISSFQIHPGSKVIHMNDIKFDLKFNKFNDVLFFDDDQRNLNELKSIGVVGYKLDPQTGLTITDVLNGLTLFDNVDTQKNT